MGVLKNEIIKSIASKFIIPNETALSNSIRDAITSGASDDVIRSIIQQSKEDKYKNLYGEMPFIDPILFNRLYRKLGEDRGNETDYLT